MNENFTDLVYRFVDLQQEFSKVLTNNFISRSERMKVCEEAAQQTLDYLRPMFCAKTLPT